MIKEFIFKFDDLQINLETIKPLLGYRNVPLPEPFDTYVETALYDAKDLSDIRGAYLIPDDAAIDYEKYRILAGEQEFHIGKAVCFELRGAERLAFFICTAGKTICEKATQLLQGDDPVLGYVYDVLGSIITEVVAARIQTFLQDETESNEDRLTNRYSPGSCQWSLTDQHKLFSLFHDNVCGVSLTHASLMNPVKSVSGVIGIGKKVKFRTNVCTLCSSKDCIYRKTENDLQLSH